jgi:hypothetical protein
MLWVCSNLSKYNEFRETFKKAHNSQLIDLSSVVSTKLADEAEAIVDHHTDCIIFLGFLEPGWMLESGHQTRIRELIRKFPVAMVTHFIQSIPYSWKNEIDMLYIEGALNGNGTPNTLDNGSSLQDESEL